MSKIDIILYMYILSTLYNNVMVTTDGFIVC